MREEAWAAAVTMRKQIPTGVNITTNLVFLNATSKEDAERLAVAEVQKDESLRHHELHTVLVAPFSAAGGQP